MEEGNSIIYLEAVGKDDKKRKLSVEINEQGNITALKFNGYAKDFQNGRRN